MRNQLRDCNKQIVTYMEGLFHESSSIIELLSHDEAVVHADEESCEEVAKAMRQLEDRIPRITYIYTGYTDGKICIADYPVPDDYDVHSRSWYQAAVQADGTAQSAYREFISGKWMLSQSKKLVDEEGNMTGVIAVDCSNESIIQQLSVKYQYDSQRSFLVDPQGLILVHPDDEEINVSVQTRIDREVWDQIVAGKRNYAEYKNNGVSKIAYFEWIPETHLLAGTGVNRSEVYRPVYYSLIFLLVLILVVSLTLSFILSKVLSLRFAGPIIELADRVQHLAKGNEGIVEATVFTNKEIDEIADGINVIVHEAMEKEERRKAAEYMSFHDSMTGLYNRRFFERELMRLDGKQNQPLCIVACDLNGLKFVNDVFGHGAGDRLISTAAKCLTEGCGERAVLARVGGDEFAMIFPRTSGEEAAEIIRRIQIIFDRQAVYGIKVSVSIGYAVKESNEQTVGDLLKAADEMMYVEKLSKSSEVKRHMVADIMELAGNNGLIRELSKEENEVLEVFAASLCPNSISLLKECYRLRKVGMCAFSNGEVSESRTGENVIRQHSEISYRILSSLDQYHEEAECILYYREHWDGSGQPAGLAGEKIPLISRILGLTEAYFEGMDQEEIEEKAGKWFDPKLVKLLLSMQRNKK